MSNTNQLYLPFNNHHKITSHKVIKIPNKQQRLQFLILNRGTNPPNSTSSLKPNHNNNNNLKQQSLIIQVVNMDSINQEIVTSILPNQQRLQLLILNRGTNPPNSTSSLKPNYNNNNNLKHKLLIGGIVNMDSINKEIVTTVVTLVVTMDHNHKSMFQLPQYLQHRLHHISLLI